jgi:hypothetical protein
MAAKRYCEITPIGNDHRTGRLRCYDNGRLEEDHVVVSGKRDSGGTSQRQRQNQPGLGYPIPDGAFFLGEYKSQHDQPVIGISPNVGSIDIREAIDAPWGVVKARSLMLLHPSVGNTNGCIGLETEGYSDGNPIIARIAQKYQYTPLYVNFIPGDQAGEEDAIRRAKKNAPEQAARPNNPSNSSKRRSIAGACTDTLVNFIRQGNRIREVVNSRSNTVQPGMFYVDNNRLFQDKGNRCAELSADGRQEIDSFNAPPVPPPPQAQDAPAGCPPQNSFMNDLPPENGDCRYRRTRNGILYQWEPLPGNPDRWIPIRE